MIFQAFEGDAPAFIRACLREKRFLETGEPEYGGNDIAIYGDSGLLLGVQTPVCLLILKALGLWPSVKTAVGCSTAAPPVLYAAADQITRGLTIYFRECVTRQFLNKRLLVREKPGVYAMGADYLMSVFNDRRSKGVDRAAVRRSHTDAYAVATDFETGAAKYFSLRDASIDPVRAVTASLADPVFSHGNVELRGRRYCDGGIGAPFGITNILKRFHPKHLLVIANGSESQKLDPNRYPNGPALGRLPEHIRSAIRAQPETVAKEIAAARKAKDCNVVIFWGPEGRSPVERVGKTIRDTGKDAARLFLAPFRTAF